MKLKETHLEQFINRSIQSIILPENVEVELDVEMKDPYVFLDADQMMQVLTNLEKRRGSHAGWRCTPHKVIRT